MIVKDYKNNKLKKTEKDGLIKISTENNGAFKDFLKEKKVTLENVKEIDNLKKEFNDKLIKDAESIIKSEVKKTGSKHIVLKINNGAYPQDKLSINFQSGVEIRNIQTGQTSIGNSLRVTAKTYGGLPHKKNIDELKESLAKGI